MKILRRKNQLPEPVNPSKPKAEVAVRESETSLAAFEYYYALGDSRSYTKVAQKFGQHKQTIFNWSKKFKWRERILDRNASFSGALKASTTAQMVDIRLEYSGYLNKMVREFFDFVEEERRGKAAELRAWRVRKRKHDTGQGPDPGTKPKLYTAIKSVADLERIIKIHLLMLAAPAPKKEEEEDKWKENELDALIRSDESIRELIAETWRRTHNIASLPGGKSQPPEKNDAE